MSKRPRSVLGTLPEQHWRARPVINEEPRPTALCGISPVEPQPAPVCDVSLIELQPPSVCDVSVAQPQPAEDRSAKRGRPKGSNALRAIFQEHREAEAAEAPPRTRQDIAKAAAEARWKKHRQNASEAAETRMVVAPVSAQQDPSWQTGAPAPADEHRLSHYRPLDHDQNMRSVIDLYSSSQSAKCTPLMKQYARETAKIQRMCATCIPWTSMAVIAKVAPNTARRRVHLPPIGS